ncbi:hypothetical protein GCM10020358_15820 [Amorphoplanes nipponensis]|uniref:Uncharacterized protein n=1 Tax=Actinoplanes nipponensis TaxID=135950 RepID=A0A919JP93_9ACTN|nr:hypothetical protein Ani05nite_64210 [Actinoplanes nipponensis]
MFPDGDTKLAALTSLGGVTERDGDAAAVGGASPRAALVAVGGVVGDGEFDGAEHAVRETAVAIAPHSPAHPRAAAMSPPKAE